jgi:hypothetical protein
MDPKDKQELLDAISNSHQVAFDAYRSLFEASVRGFSEQLGQFEERNAAQHKEIKDKQDITNGRVNKLEKETFVFRWAHKNPKSAIIITVLLLSGVVALVAWLGFETTIKLI